MLILELMAILSCTIFSGASIYINLAEHPARMECGTELAATVFAPSYRRAALMQATLAMVATITGLTLAIMSGDARWYVGAALIFFVVPFTFIGIMPTNNKLLDSNRDRCSAETASLLKKWGLLHAVRSLTSTISAVLYIYLGLTLT